MLVICAMGNSALMRAQAPENNQSRSASFESLAKSASVARDGGKTDEAIQDYRQALAIRPSWAEGWWNLGTLLYDADRYQDAKQAFEHLVELAPKLGAAWDFLGLCEYEAKDYAASLKNLQEGLELGSGDDPEIARVSAYHLGLLLIRDGKFERASAVLLTSAGAGQVPQQIKTALAMAMLRIPLMPEEVDPSHDAVLHAVGEAAVDLARQDYERALARFQKLVVEYPEVPYMHYSFGLALAAAEKFADAIEQQKKEAAISPQSTLPWMELASFELRDRHPTEAISAAQHAVRLAPDSPAAHRRYSEVLKAAGQAQRAEDELRVSESLASKEAPVDTATANLYAHQPGISAGATAQSVNAPVFTELARQAAAAQTAGDTAASIRYYRQALQQRSDWTEGYWNLGMLCFLARQFPETVAALKQFVALSPGNGTAWAVMGLSEFETHDYDNALVHLQRGYELGFGGSTESVELANYRLGILLIHASRFEHAAEVLAAGTGSNLLLHEMEFARGLAMLRMSAWPDQVEASRRSLVQQSGEIASLLAQSKYDVAFAKFQELLKRYPTAPFLHYAYGTALIAFSQYNEAREQMIKERVISPTSPLPELRLASIALRQHRPADAIEPAQHALRLEPDSAEAHYFLGRANLELGHVEIAIVELEKASALQPGSPEVHFNLAKAYNKAGLTEKAQQERATFTRLNAIAEEQRSHAGNQSYSGPRNSSDFSSASTQPAEQSLPDPH